MDRKVRLLTSVICAWVGIGSSPMAFSSENRSSALMEEVVVTAQKREENIQDVSIAVSAFSGDQIRELGMNQGYQVADQVPNFNFNATGGSTSPVAYFNIRGVQIVDFSLANDPSVGIYMDEVYQPAQGAALSQLFDVERVEVLRGPQGTLFGRNITGGLLHTISKSPTEETSGYLSASYGEFAKTTVEGALSGSLGDTVRARVAVRNQSQDGWQTDILTGRDDLGESDSWAARVILEADLSDRLLGTFSVHASDADSTTPQRGLYGNLDPITGDRCSPERIFRSECVNAAGLRDPSPDPENVYVDIARKSFSKASGASMKFEYSTDWADFVSLTAYEEYEGQHGGQVSPPGNLALGFIFHTEAESFSQEFRATGDTMGGGTWAAGVYYYEDEKPGDSATIVNTRPYLPLVRQTSTETWAVFMQLEQPVTETVSLIAGGRYTDETRTLDFITDTNPASPTFGPIDLSPLGDDDQIDSGEFTGKVGMEWRPTESLMMYGHYSRGYKSGGFNPERDLSRVGPVEPETLNAWELGWKSDLANGRVRLNGTAFVYDFQGYQSLVTRTAEVNSIVTVETRFINLEDADIYGAELELSAFVTANLYASLGLGLLNTQLNSDDTVTVDGTPLDGNELPNSPEASLNGIIRYAIPTDSGEFALQGDFRWQDDIFHNVDNHPFERQESFAIVNLRAFWRSPDGKWNAEAFIENVGDEEYTLQSLFSTALATSNRSWGYPQWWGVKFGYDF